MVMKLGRELRQAEQRSRGDRQRDLLAMSRSRPGTLWVDMCSTKDEAELSCNTGFLEIDWLGDKE